MNSRNRDMNKQLQKIAAITLIFILLLLNIIMAYRFSRYKLTTKTSFNKVGQALEKSKSLNKKLIYMINNNLISEATQLDQNMILHGFYSKNNIKLKEFLSNTPILFLRFTEFSCSVCVEHTLKIIKKMPRIFLQGKFVIIASNSNIRNLLSFMKSNNLKFPVFVVKDNTFPVPLEKLHFPYLFILDQSAKSTNIFYPLTSYPDLTSDYLEIIHKKFPDLFY